MTPHDYAEGTRARRWLAVLLGPLLIRAVRALLWLCPDTAIIANCAIGKNGSAIHMSAAKGGGIHKVRVEMWADDTFKGYMK
jgi:hypothetical protein